MTLTESELRDVIARRCNDSSQKEVAPALGISPQYLNDIVNGRRGISAEVAKALGYRPVVSFEPLNEVSV